MHSFDDTADAREQPLVLSLSCRCLAPLLRR